MSEPVLPIALNVREHARTAFICSRCKMWHRADENHAKPSLGDEYERWLDGAWTGDARELREGRYLHQQTDLLKSFESSEYWSLVDQLLPEWARDYAQECGVSLFRDTPRLPVLLSKSWESFLNRSWRHNVHLNDNWPDPPVEGWRFPDTWFEESWDVVRTRFVLRYLDGVKWMADQLSALADHVGIQSYRISHAQDTGYYAIHIIVPQSFMTQSLNYDGLERRTSKVEVQLTTELQDVVVQLTHPFFETRRVGNAGASGAWQWEYDAPEFTPNYLGHMLHYLEGMIMQLRSSPRGLHNGND